MTIGSSRATALSTDSQWIRWSVSYLWTTVIKRVSKKFFCSDSITAVEKLFTHSEWPPWYTPEAWEVTDNNDRNESANEFSEIIRSYSPVSQ